MFVVLVSIEKKMIAAFLPQHLVEESTQSAVDQHTTRWGFPHNPQRFTLS